VKIFRLLFIAICIVVFSLSIHVSVMAQTNNEPTGYRQVTLSINPEYDDHRLLVMMEGQIVGVKAPAKVRFLVPSVAEMYSAGSKDAQGVYSGGPPARQSSAIQGWDEISYEATSETFRVEYYDPSIIGSPDKTISYEFRSLYPVTNLQVLIQQPFASSNFVISRAGQVFIDSEGFTEYSYTYPAFKVGDILDFEISYSKSDPRPSLSIKGDIPAQGKSNSLPLIIIPIALGVVLVAVILIRRRNLILKTKRRRSPAAKFGRSKGNRSSTEGFCRKCGIQIEGPFLFCPHCGTKRAGKKGDKSV
jgi:hypothetical protein